MKVNRTIFILMFAFLACACSSSSQSTSRKSPFRPIPPANPAQATTTGESEGTAESAKDSRQPGEAKPKKPDLPTVAADVKTGLLGLSTGAAPEPAALPSKDKQKVILNFDKADLLEVTNQIFGEYLKLNYVLDPSLQGRINMYIEGEFTKDELFQMITKVYEANNVSIVSRKGVYYIQPIQKSSSSSLPIANALTLKEDKQGVKPLIVIYRLRFMDVKQAMNTIRFFLTPGRPITSDNLSNSLIFVEDNDNARAIIEVLKALDINILREVSMEIVPLQSIAPQDAAQSVEAVMSKLGVFKDSSIKNAVALIPLQSFGGVLVLAHDNEILKTTKYWLTALDVHTQESGEQIFVYFVQNGLAADIADILNQVYGFSSGSSRPSKQVVQSIRPSGSRGGFGSGSSSFGSGGFGSGSFGSGRFGSSSSSSYGSSSGVFGSSSGSRMGTSGSGSSQSQSGGTRSGGAGAFGTSGQKKVSGLSGDVVIIPDEVNNAIVIRANAADYAKIKKTLDSLDILPRAVLIEMMIAEITLNKDFEYGLQYFFNNINTNNGKFTAGHGKAGLNSTTLNLVNTTGLNLFWTNFSGNIQILLSLLSEKTTVNVLSTPTLLATDNKEASITVGGRQPIPLGTTISTDTTYSSIDYEETGVIMNVIPHINAGGLVRLEVEQTIRTVDNEAVTVGNDATAPSFLERNVKTTLLAQDGATVVIGGIIQQETTQKKKGIPWLQDIPLISPLFTNKSDSTKRTELVIAITPHVVSHRESESTREFMDRLRELRGRIEKTRM